MSDPKIPDIKGEMPDESGYSEVDKTEEKKDEGKAEVKPADKGKASAQDDRATDETQKANDEQIKKLTEGWREDREEAQAEITRLKAELRTTKPTKDEEDELEGLDEQERVEKIIQIRKAKEKELESAELKQVQSEIRFYERTDKVFSDNKAAILKVAQDYDCRNLQQAILIWRGLEKDKANKDASYNDKRKADADGKAGGKAAGTTAGRPYSPKLDRNKSFGDLFREGGVK
jgi:hypothetical protein